MRLWPQPDNSPVPTPPQTEYLLGAAMPGSTGAVDQVVPSFAFTLLASQRVRHVRDFGAVGNGIADDTDAFATADGAARADGTSLLLPTGTYRIASHLSLGAVFVAAPGAVLKPDPGVTIIISGPVVAGLHQIADIRAGMVIVAGAPVVYPEWYGAKPDNITDCAAAIQACIESAKNRFGATDGAVVQFSTGQYRLVKSAVDLSNCQGVVLRGASMRASRIISARVDLFTWSSSLFDTVFQLLRLTSSPGGGHVFNVTGNGSTSRVTFRQLVIEQENRDKSFYSHTQGHASLRNGFIDNLVTECDMYGRSACDHTVALWNITSRGNCAVNTWFRNRFTYSGNYVIAIDDRSGGSSWAYQNFFRELNFEVPAGGCIALYNARYCEVEHVGVWDLQAFGAARRDLFLLGASRSGGGYCRDITFRGVNRLGGSLGARRADIRYDPTGVSVLSCDVIYERCGNAGGETFRIDCGSRNSVVRYCTGASIQRLGPKSVREETTS